MSQNLYTKYNITNDEWHLNVEVRVDNTSVGELIRGLYIPMAVLGNNVGLPPYGNYKLLPFDVQSECDRLDSVGNYYYRNVINPVLFKNNDYRELNDYNIDPWGRSFPNYMTGIIGRRYIDAMMENSSHVYSYVAFYQERLIRSSNVGKFEHYLIGGSVPLAVLHTTSLEGESIVCVDIIH